MKLFGLEVTRNPGRHREGQVARAASEPIYSGGDYGWTSIVPTLQLSLGRTKVDYTSDVEKNPLLAIPIVQTAVRMGALPIGVYEIDAKTGNREQTRTHPGYRLLRNPNPAMSKSLFIAGTVQSLLAFKQAAWLKTREKADEPPVELWPVAGWAIRMRRDKNKLVKGYEVSTDEGWRPVPDEDVCFFRLLPAMGDWLVGGGTVDTLGAVATLGNTAINALNDLFSNGFLERFALTHPGTISEGAIKRISAQMRGTRVSAGEVPFFEEGIKPASLGRPPDDEALVRSFVESLGFIRSAFGMSDDDSQFYARAVQPIADCLEQEMERSLFSEWPKQPAFPEFGFRENLKGSPKERIELHARAILSMQETPNEARREENKPPEVGGDTLFGPLNVSPVQELLLEGRRPEFRGTTRRKDTKGSLGGDFVEGGKGTLPTEPSPQHPVGRADGNGWTPVTEGMASEVMAADELREAIVGGLPARIAGRGANWATMRSRLIDKQAEALSNRLRGIVKREQRALRAAIAKPSRTAGPDGKYPLVVADLIPLRADSPMPSHDELMAAIRADSEEIVALIAQFSRQVGDEAVRQAAELVAAEAADLETSIAEAIASRAEVIADRFVGVQSQVIADAIQNAVTNGLRVEDFAAQLIEDFGVRSVALADGIARTEMAWAYEQGAMREWANAGFDAYEIRFGGGPCSTGVCERNAANGPYTVGGPGPENVGSSFSLAEAPPYHANCTCYALPVVPSAIVGG